MSGDASLAYYAIIPGTILVVAIASLSYKRADNEKDPTARKLRKALLSGGHRGIVY
jgi:hypothetical protein